MLSVEGFSYAYPGEDAYVLRDVNMKVGPGECHAVTGPTGCGKSTLALAIRGLLPDGRSGGVIRLSHGAGIVLQNPVTQLFGHSIGAEVAFGLENMCVEPRLMEARVRAALGMAGLDRPLSARTDSLSMGQKYRLLIAAQLVMGHRLVILDEPVAQLDRAGADRLLATIRELKREGVSFLLFEHEPGPLAGAIDAFWELGPDGALLPGSPPTQDAGAGLRCAGACPAEGAPVVVAEGLSFRYRYGLSPVFRDVNFTVRRGQRLAVKGGNGAGKTTLLRCIAGMVKPSSGRLAVFGEEPSPAGLSGRALLIYQDPLAQIFEDTVEAEVGFASGRGGADGAELSARVAESMEMCGIAALAGRSPHKLSYGQKRLVAMAGALAARPELLLLDDPFAGLDPAYKNRMEGTLASYSGTSGAAVVWTTHEPYGTDTLGGVLLDGMPVEADAA